MSGETAANGAIGVTRRTALGAGLAFASLACFDRVGAHGSSAQPGLPIDVLLVDQTIAMPAAIVRSIECRSPALRVVDVRLDAAGRSRLQRTLEASQVVAGISSGATLFCLERIAWDHGLRLSARSEQDPDSQEAEAFRRMVAAFLSGAALKSASCSPLAEAYRPSRADGTLHAWAMLKSAAVGPCQPRRQGRT